MTTRPLFSSTISRSLALLATSAFVLGCSFSPSPTGISPLVVEEVKVQKIRLSSFSLERAYKRGLIPELITHLQTEPFHILQDPEILDVLGRSLLAERRLNEARVAFARAGERYGANFKKANVAWFDSRAAFLNGDSVGAYQSAQAAYDAHLKVPLGWLRYLENLSTRDPVLNRVTGGPVTIPMLYGQPKLPRIYLRANGRDSLAIIDTGASISFLTETEAARLGVVPLDATAAVGRGLHGSEFPTLYGVLDRLEIGSMVVESVPVGIIPDWALEFEGKDGTTSYNFLLGAQFWQRFRVVLDYPGKKLGLEPLAPEPIADSSDGGFSSLASARSSNLFLIDGKPIARATVNGIGWFRFLLDTGSEFTLIHKSGYNKFGHFAAEAPIDPVTIHGIGKSQSQWSKVEEVTIGVDSWQISFADLLLTTDKENLDDGILGSNFLENFVVELDFGTGRITMDRPEEQLALTLDPDE